MYFLNALSPFPRIGYRINPVVTARKSRSQEIFDDLMSFFEDDDFFSPVCKRSKKKEEAKKSAEAEKAQIRDDAKEVADNLTEMADAAAEIAEDIRAAAESAKEEAKKAVAECEKSECKKNEEEEDDFGVSAANQFFCSVTEYTNDGEPTVNITVSYPESDEFCGNFNYCCTGIDKAIKILEALKVGKKV